jgi:hypothetical protein
MSFISILKTIGSTLLGIEHVAVPIADALLPAADPIIAEVDTLFGRLQNAITTVEANSPVGTAGTLKSDIVTQDFNASLGVAQSVLAMAGKQLSYDTAALQTAINAQVTAYNAMAALKASFKVIDVPKA